MVRYLNNQYSDGKKFSEMYLEEKILSRSAGLGVPQGKSAKEALSAFNGRIAGLHGPASRKSATDVRRIVFTISSVAATALVLIGVWLLFLRNQNNEVIANSGTHVEHRLPDGSQVTINAGSKISYNSHSFIDNRQVELEGEAFFNVEKGNTFQISTKRAKITVLGTSFNVFSRDDQFKVTCLTGKIKVAADGQTVEITPGESADLTGNELVMYRDDNIDKSAAWIKGEFYYENSPLNQIFSEIERQFNVKFAAGDLKDKYFTGSFTNNNLKNALDIVCIPMGLTYEIGNKGKILIKEKTQ